MGKSVAEMRSHRGKTRHNGTTRLEMLESRVLLSGTYIPAFVTGSWTLGGLNKSGVLAFDGVSAITAGGWTSQDGSTQQLITGTNSTFTLDVTGAAGLSVESAFPGATVSSTTLASGIISATRDVLTLNEATGAVPVAGGLDLLVNHAGAFTVADLAGTWTISGADFRGTITLDVLGHVTAGSITRESNQKTSPITAGTATLNANGTGTLALSTKFVDADAALATVALQITMNSAKDVVMGTNANIGQPAVPSGTGPASLTLLVKSAGTYARSDVAGVTWTIASTLGAGTLTLGAGGGVSGTLHGTDGFTWNLAGSYTISSAGALTTTFTATHGSTTSHFTLTGALNRAKNLIALDRTAVNAGTDSSLTLLVSPANHAPTELPSALWPDNAFHASTISIDYAHLLIVTGASDLDNDPLSFLITDVPAANGSMTLTHGPLTTGVTANVTTMVAGDTLTWAPSASAAGKVNAFTVRATDGTAFAANGTQITINTEPIAVVSAKATVANALETKAGSHAGDGKIQILRAGGDQTKPLTVTLEVTGTAQQGVNYKLLAPDGVTVLASASPAIIIPGGQSGVTLTVTPLDDQSVDPTLSVLVSVAADPNGVSPAYSPGVPATAQVNVLDGSPQVAITAAVKAINEGAANVRTFNLVRTAAQGGNLSGSLTVNLTYSGTFDTASHLTAPSTIVFAPGQRSKIVTLSTTDNHIADPTQTLVATIDGDGFLAAGTGSAAVKVLDASPVVTVVPAKSPALEAHPLTSPGRYTIRRTGSTALPVTVEFTTASGGTFGTRGTNYTLTDGSGNALTNAVVIPAGRSSVTVNLTPVDDGANDPTLQATLTLQADGVPTYHVGAQGSAVVAILNNDRRPTVVQSAVIQSTAVNTALTLSHDQLVSLTGAALAPGETHGVLQFKVAGLLSGTLQIQYAGGGAEVIATVGTLFNPGDLLVWTPPAGLHGVTVKGFTLATIDGTLAATVSTRFSVAVG